MGYLVSGGRFRWYRGLESVDVLRLSRALRPPAQVMGHMAVPRVLKNTNVRGATIEAPLTGERDSGDEGGRGREKIGGSRDTERDLALKVL